MSKKDEKKKKGGEKNYFKQLYKTSHYAVELSNTLGTMLNSLPMTNENAITLHKMEHEADIRNDELIDNLYKEFLPPIERDDLMNLVYSLDDVIDAIEDVGVRLFMLRITGLKPEAKEVISVIAEMSLALEKAFGELHNFKKPKTIYPYLKEIGQLEEKGDQIYRGAVRKLFDEAENTVKSTMDIMKWRELFEIMESACTAFENAANRIQDTIMKNN